MTTTITALDDAQRSAVEADPLISLAITGPCGSGKSTALRARRERLAAEFPEDGFIELAHPSELGAVARDVLTLGGTPIELIDDVDAAALFAHAATPLFALEWDEVTAGE
ncbi:MAG: hypothetical protein KGN02_15105, partial [bacterium]|nr:hypothetical protein [bacterium]